MRIAIRVWVILAVFALLPMATTAQPTVAIYTDDDTYQPGDTIEVSLSAVNGGEGMSVAVYVGLILPDGDIWSCQYAGWSDTIEPWIPQTYIPGWFAMGRTPFWWFDLSCSMPPIEEPGDYSFAAVLTYPGTFDWVSDLSLAPFTLGASNRLHCYVDAGTGDDSNDGSFGSPWNTITRALASVEGTEANPVTIHVAAGTYSASTNGETFPLNMKSWVSLSGADAETTILDAEKEAGHVIYCRDLNSVTIRGFTITGGLENDEWAVSNGAGIYCSDSSITIENNIITGNCASNSFWGGGSARGGGIYCKGSSTIIQTNVIADNRVWDYKEDDAYYAYGGGIYSSGGSTLIQDNVVSGNRARAISSSCFSAHGGGICCSGDAVIIQNNIISDNSADGLAGEGGGILAWGSAIIERNSITGNYANRYGGGISCTGSPAIWGNVLAQNSASAGGGLFCQSDCTARIEANVVCDNLAGDRGAGIYCSRHSSSIRSNVILRNEAGYDGSGVFIYEGSPTLQNNTIIYNSGTGISNGYHRSPGLEGPRMSPSNDWATGYTGFTRPTITDCIIWANGNDLYGCSAIFSCIEDGDSGLGNIHDDPMFVPGPLGHYYLHSDSPCIDAGSQSAQDAGLSDSTTQVDGTPDTGVVDMGYHYPIP